MTRRTGNFKKTYDKDEEFVSHSDRHSQKRMKNDIQERYNGVEGSYKRRRPNDANGRNFQDGKGPRRHPFRDGKPKSKLCLGCRQPGHTLANCPTSNSSSRVCYHCESTEHTTKSCSLPKEEQNFAYATCFVCNQKGHLVSQCPENDKGVYPKGGKCRFCGSVRHLAKDCDQRKDKKERREFRRSQPVVPLGADDDELHGELRQIPLSTPVKKAGPKLVKF